MVGHVPRMTTQTTISDTNERASVPILITVKSAVNLLYQVVLLIHNTSCDSALYLNHW